MTTDIAKTGGAFPVFFENAFGIFEFGAGFSVLDIALGALPTGPVAFITQTVFYLGDWGVACSVCVGDAIPADFTFVGLTETAHGVSSFPTGAGVASKSIGGE